MEGLKVSGKTNLMGFYRAKVENNMDPRKLGRIKARVYPFFVDIKAEDLPWAVPAMAISTGSGNGTGTFCVPDVGTFIWVFFEAGNYYQPVYAFEAPTAGMGIPTESSVDYPKRRVIKTPAGFIIYVDDQSKELRIQHPKGGYINLTDEPRITAYHPTGSYGIIDENGDVKLHANRDIVATANRDANITANRNINMEALVNVGIHAVGTISITSDNTAGGGSAAANNITINGKVNATINGDVDATVNGDVDAKVNGSSSVDTSGTTEIKSGGPVTITAPAINMNTSS